MGWLRDEQRGGGPQGWDRIRISVRMNRNLKAHIRRLSEPMWKPYREDGEAEIECADLLNNWPEAEQEKQRTAALRRHPVPRRQGSCSRWRRGEKLRSGVE
jgi:hypothetical protein